MKKKLGFVALLLVLFTAAALCTVLVSGANVTASDPVISLSYLTGTFQKETEAKIETLINTEKQKLEKTLSERISSVNTVLSQSAPAPTHTTASINAGTTYTVPAGSEFLFLSGRAVVKGAGLSDLTDGQLLSGDSELIPNHLYTAASQLQLQANAAAKILITK